MKKLTFGPYSINVADNVTMDQTPTFGPMNMATGNLVLNMDNKGTKAVITPPVMDNFPECVLVFEGSGHPLVGQEYPMDITLKDIEEVLSAGFE